MRSQSNFKNDDNIFATNANILTLIASLTYVKMFFYIGCIDQKFDHTRSRDTKSSNTLPYVERTRVDLAFTLEDELELKA